MRMKFTNETRCNKGRLVARTAALLGLHCAMLAVNVVGDDEAAMNRPERRLRWMRSRLASGKCTRWISVTTTHPQRQ
jgi:hypothetical protein